jgi:hypothetical protein
MKYQRIKIGKENISQHKRKRKTEINEARGIKNYCRQTKIEKLKIIQMKKN